jgi:hypothetical protein
MDYARDRAMSALILGFFASCWFGWAQERPPPSWRAPLIAGACLSLAVAGAGAVLAWRAWSGPSALSAPGAMRQYGIAVGVEFALAAAGAAALSLRGLQAYVAPWICLVVGVHFWPLAPLLQDRGLIGLGAVLVVIAVVGLFAGRLTGLAPSSVTGAGAGSALLVYAAWGAATAVT